MDKLELDYNFAVHGHVKNGFTADELEKQKQKARHGYARLMDMVKAGQVGFPSLATQNIDEIKKFAKDLYRSYNDLVVIGIGGSSLGFEAIVNAMLPQGYNSLSFADRRSYPRFWLLDNADPTIAHSVLKYCSPEDTFVVVISKSGSTIETQANFALIYEWLKSKPIDIKKHVAVITDAEKGTLRKLSNDTGIPAFTLPDNVGGRFSVLSPVGLVPAALLGVDIERILMGAKSVVEGEFEKFLTMAAIYMHFMEKGRSINVLMPYSSRLIKFAEWFCQLWGESLGKRRTLSGAEINFGTTPIRTAGSIDQHSQLQLFCEGPDDKFITFVGLSVHDNDKVLKTEFSESFSYANGAKMGELLNNELMATEAALLELSRPTMRLNLQQLDEIGLGQLFMVFQYVIAVIGLANDIDPFDQPGVEAGKDYVYGIMGKQGYDRRKEYFDQVYIKREEYII